MRRSRGEYRIPVVDGLERVRRLSVPFFLRPRFPDVRRPAGRRCHSQETTPMYVDVADAGRVLRRFMGFAHEREYTSPHAAVVALGPPFNALSGDYRSQFGSAHLSGSDGIVAPARWQPKRQESGPARYERSAEFPNSPRDAKE